MVRLSIFSILSALALGAAALPGGGISKYSEGGYNEVGGIVGGMEGGIEYGKEGSVSYGVGDGKEGQGSGEKYCEPSTVTVTEILIPPFPTCPPQIPCPACLPPPSPCPKCPPPQPYPACLPPPAPATVTVSRVTTVTVTSVPPPPTRPVTPPITTSPPTTPTTASYGNLCPHYCIFTTTTGSKPCPIGPVTPCISETPVTTTATPYCTWCPTFSCASIRTTTVPFTCPTPFACPRTVTETAAGCGYPTQPSGYTYSIA